MTAGVYTVHFNKVRKNVDFRKVVTLYDGETPPAAINIAAATFFMDVVPKLGTPTPILSLSLGSGLSLLTDGSDGKLLISVDSAVMETKDVGSYKYDLIMVRSGVSETVMEGNFKIKSGVTDLD